MLRFLYSLVALALVLSPLGMVQGDMAVAHAAAIADGHCGGSQIPADGDEGSKSMMDCAGICSALAAGDGLTMAPDAWLSSAIDVPNISALTGLHPESEPPPPRTF